MKALLIATAFIETGAGLAILISPAGAVPLLLVAEVGASFAVVARVAGIALVSLGVACLLALADKPGHSIKTVIVPMFVYNTATVVVLTSAGFGSVPVGIALWPAVIVHLVMATWCAVSLQGKPGL